MYAKNSAQWQLYPKMTAYSFVLMLIQAHWISHLPYAGLRVDLLLPLMFGVAIEWSPFMSLLWAFFWGYVMDTLSGKFWGFHVGSYVAAICLVNIAIERFEVHNPFYQMSFVGVCALGQSFVLGLFLLFEPSGSLVVVSTWRSLAIRSLVMMLLTPAILFPVWRARGSNR